MESTHSSETKKFVSILIPFYNESHSLNELCQRIENICLLNTIDYEAIFIDDGSSDNGSEIIRALQEKNPRITLIKLTRNFGKSAALSAGFKNSRGSIVITMDADLQDDPAEIPKFIKKIDDGFDAVSGWKKTRNDPPSKVIPSRIFNSVTSYIFKTELHDMNCGFKAYSKRAVEEINIYGEHHRFIPVLLSSKGFRASEITVSHSPRKHGVSKFGSERLLRGFFDALTILMLSRFRTRPLHFIGLPGLAILSTGAITCIYLAILWSIGDGPIGDRPLLLFGILCFFVGVQLITVGLLAELLVATSIREKDKYVVSEINMKSHDN